MLTVLVATHNGANHLRNVLEAYTRLEPPSGGWKLVYINNNSTDNTVEILEAFQNRLPLTILQEPKRGKNTALNKGLAALEGDLVVFTDDDTIVPPTWLVDWRKITDDNPDISIFGGRIVPYWEVAPPEWLLKAIPLGPAYGISPEDMPAGPVNPGMVWGGNMAIKAHIFAEGNKFDEGIGPSSGNYMMGSETEFNHRLAARGHECMRADSIVVQHIIRAYQLDPVWLGGRAFRYGRQNGWVAKSKGKPKVPLLAGYPRWMIKDLCILYCQLCWGRLWRDRNKEYSACWCISEIKGYLSEIR